MELWGGVECTINRVGNEYFEQLERTGHTARIEDLELFQRLGIRAFRFPVLWERIAPTDVSMANWEWTDRYLHKLRETQLRTIAGLVHHGSGPSNTDLLDPDFAHKLARFAEAVAARYPWISDYTPVNEPLTTARFSALYGIWYPHLRNDNAFVRALLNQCRAVVLAMRAIRKVNPEARLIQTDDLGKVFSTPELKYQADFENERRWLSFDILTGTVNREHRLWGYLRSSGIEEKEILWFTDNPCSPNIIGLNYYLSSERYLDHRVELYPGVRPGANGMDNYVDVLAARVRWQGIAGAEQLLCEAWDRFKIPLAITECHNGCTREQQMRWFHEVWQGANRARQTGADVRAVTAWSLLGAFDWDQLVTEKNNRYEPGVFDVRAPRPRPTAMVKLLSELAAGRAGSHPVLHAHGWWRQPKRFQYGFVVNDRGTDISVVSKHATIGGHEQPVLIAGSGTLGQAFARICSERGIHYKLAKRTEMDITDAASVRAAVESTAPWAVINAAGYVRVDDAEMDREMCDRANHRGAVLLAEECDAQGIKFLTFSSDLVFGGRKCSPYVESDPVGPLNQYGRSKGLAERRVLELQSGSLVVRSSAFFGPWDKYNFVYSVLRALASRKEFFIAHDSVVSPTYIVDLVNVSLDLLIDGEEGIWHLANAGEISWKALAQRVAELWGLDSSLIKSRHWLEARLSAPRPVYSALTSERASIMPSLDDALLRYHNENVVLRKTAEVQAVA